MNPVNLEIRFTQVLYIFIYRSYSLPWFWFNWGSK